MRIGILLKSFGEFAVVLVGINLIRFKPAFTWFLWAIVPISVSFSKPLLYSLSLFAICTSQAGLGLGGVYFVFQFSVPLSCFFGNSMHVQLGGGEFST